jgi:benzoyl-CoA reductase/2-hydroxyglutaryl-CoA dehydratase subunit BcrC/BadD/HgdB
MRTIAYCSPLMPVEWIAAHGLRPQWLSLRPSMDRPSVANTRGVCPYAGAVIDAALAGTDGAALVLATVCDQMRYAAALVGSRGRRPVFLLNVPSTWQTAAARDLYLAELRRLGQFLVQMGGTPPTDGALGRMMLAYDHARQSACAVRDRLSARQFSQLLAALRGPLDEVSMELPNRCVKDAASAKPSDAPREGIPLAVLGGPLLEADDALWDLIEQAGGRVVLDATEGGQRTLPARFDPIRTASDPLGELTAAYFGGIPDVFRRPNSGLYEWLGRELAARRVRGIIFRRYLWCDLWHAELHRLRQWSPVPVLELDVAPGDLSASGRMQVRVEAMLEMLR